MEQKTNSPFRLIVLGLLATCLLVPYFAYCFVIPQTPARLSRPSASLAADFPFWSWILSLPLVIPKDSEAVAILLVSVTVMAFGVYGVAIYLSWKLPARPASLALVLIPAWAFLLLSTFALPNLNTDIFNYMLRGRLGAIYHKDPYTAAADEIPSDPVYPYASHSYTEEPEWWKLPLWTSIEVGLARLTGEDVLKNLLTYRIAFLLVNLANLILSAVILNRINQSYIVTGLVVYAWNPIIVVLGQSKGDTFVVFFLLLAILLLAYERRNLAVVPLTLSILIKLTTLPFAAAYMLADLKRKRWKEYFILGLLFAVTAGVFYLRYGLGDFLAIQLISVMGMSAASVPDFLRSFLRVIFVGLILVIGLTRRADQKHMIFGWVLLALFFSLFLTGYEKAWYLITLVGLACLVPDWRTVALTLVISFSGFLIYTWNSGFNQELAAPISISLPRYVIYLMLPVVVLITLGAILLRRQMQQKWNGQVDAFPPKPSNNI
jgi:hypothetical protein